jgi:hypothetical protein
MSGKEAVGSGGEGGGAPTSTTGGRGSTDDVPNAGTTHTNDETGVESKPTDTSTKTTKKPDKTTKKPDNMTTSSDQEPTGTTTAPSSGETYTGKSTYYYVCPSLLLATLLPL